MPTDLTPPIPYDRARAVAYAHKWAFGRNPAYYDYEDIGGDCTNFASQCLFAGTGVMNYTPTFGWYYINANQKAPAWTGVPYFYNFMTRLPPFGAGPVGVEVNDLSQMMPGDFVQLMFREGVWGHTPIIVSMGRRPTLENTLIAAHSYDADYRPLSSYTVLQYRFIHILGAYPQRPIMPREEN